MTTHDAEEPSWTALNRNQGEPVGRALELIPRALVVYCMYTVGIETTVELRSRAWP